MVCKNTYNDYECDDSECNDNECGSPGENGGSSDSVIYVSSVSVSPSYVNLTVGEWYHEATAEVYPSNADDTGIIWCSDNDNVASVNPSNGYIYAKASGSARIYATATDGSDCSDYLIVTVSAILPVSSIVLSQTRVTLEEGEDTALCATVFPHNATNQSIRWSSSNSCVAEVNPWTGHIYAVTVGSTIIQATACDGSGATGECIVEIKPKTIKVTSISMHLTNQIVATKTGTLVPTVLPDNATNKKLLWESSNEKIATVCDGVVYGHSAGNVTIKAMATDGSGVYASCAVTVAAYIPVSAISVCSSCITVKMGEQLEPLCYCIFPENATNKDVEWHSSNSNVVSINSTLGLPIPVAPGTATIYAVSKDQSDVVGCCTITVTPIPVEQITICPSTTTMNVGEEEKLNVEITPKNATDKAIKWESSDPKVATVTRYTGRVKAVSPGKATITVRTHDERLISEATVIVGYSAIINGQNVTVAAEDDEIADFMEQLPMGDLYVYADDVLLTSARREATGDITVCIGEIAYPLCTEYIMNWLGDRLYFATSHSDTETFYEITYSKNDLGPCPIDDGVSDRITLSRFLQDLGYASKYSSITTFDGRTFVFIQGHGWKYRKALISFSPEEVASLTLGFIPIVGDLIDAAEGISGKDFITGEPLTAFEQYLCIGCTLSSFVNGAVIRAGKKGLTKLDNFLKYTDKLTDIQKAAIRTDVWKILRPITRGICLETEFARSVYKITDGWFHIGKEMNGFFPVVDFIKLADKTDDIVAISMKTLDPRLYKLADGSYDVARIKNVINKYIEKLNDAPIYVNDTFIKEANRQLDLVIPSGYNDLVKNLKEIDTKSVIYNILEF